MAFDFMDHSLMSQHMDAALKKGVESVKHPFHTFSLATITHVGRVDQRSVVLRQWEIERRSIIFFTDVRSPKVSQLARSPHCSVLFYSYPDRLQLRFSCYVHIHQFDRLSDYFFNELSDSQRTHYMADQSPSTDLDFEKKGTSSYQQVTTQSQDPYQNFSVGVCNFDHLDLLYLGKDKHIRVVYSWDKEGNLVSKNIGV